MPRLHNLAHLTLITALVVPFAGCGGSAEQSEVNRPPVSIDELEHDHPPHAHAESYNAAVAELDTMRTQISTAFAAGDIKAADGPIHEVGHVLEHVVELAQEEGFSETVIAEINAAVQTLFDTFGRVDEKIHGGEGVEYSEVADQIDAALETLKKHTTATAETTESTESTETASE